MTVAHHLLLPVPPPNNQYRIPVIAAGRPTIVVSKDGRDYQKAIAKMCSQLRPLHGDVIVQRLHIKTREGAMDFDAPFKALFDSLQGFAYLDDNQVRGVDGYRMAFGGPSIDIILVAERWCSDAEVELWKARTAATERKRKASLEARLVKKRAMKPLATSASYAARAR